MKCRSEKLVAVIMTLFLLVMSFACFGTRQEGLFHGYLSGAYLLAWFLARELSKIARMHGLNTLLIQLLKISGNYVFPVIFLLSLLSLLLRLYYQEYPKYPAQPESEPS